MKPALAASVVLVLLALRPGPGFSAKPTVSAISGQVSGKVQQVGFRALILKEAIRFNLAGTAKNNPDKTVAFVLQGDPGRIAEALKVIAKGTAKSSDVKVDTKPAEVDPKLKTFTVIGWTSTSRHITNPYDLVFTLRQAGKTVSEEEAHKEYHRILKKTLKKEDLKKVGLE